MNNKNQITTENLADFRSRERGMLLDILQAWEKDGLPEDFHQDEVRPMMNRNSGHVFLINSEYQTAMMNGDKLEIWHYCSNCGHEGFVEDCKINDDGCECCHPTDEKDTK
jgi:hypothetical protein